MKARMWVELIAIRGKYSGSVHDLRVGRTFKRRPLAHQIQGGAIAVEVNLEVPADRLDHVVAAVVPTAPAVKVAS